MPMAKVILERRAVKRRARLTIHSTRDCLVCRGSGRDPMSDNVNWLPCSSCGGSGVEVRL